MLGLSLENAQSARKKTSAPKHTHTHNSYRYFKSKKKRKRKLKKMSGTVNYILSWLATNDSDCSKSICNTASPRVASHLLTSLLHSVTDRIVTICNDVIAPFAGFECGGMRLIFFIRSFRVLSNDICVVVQSNVKLNKKISVFLFHNKLYYLFILWMLLIVYLLKCYRLHVNILYVQCYFFRSDSENTGLQSLNCDTVI